MINLTIKKALFQKKLLLLGYNYKITQYEDFIESIQRIIFNNLKEAYTNDNLEEKMMEVYGQSMPIEYLLKKEGIVLIKKEYMVSMMEEGVLDLYLEIENAKEYSKEIQKEAYMYLLGTSMFINNSVLLNKSKSIRITKCILNNGINLSNEDKEEIENKIKDIFVRAAYLRNQHLLSRKIYNHININDVFIHTVPNKLAKYIDIENIEDISGKNKVEFVFPKNTETYLSVIDDLHSSAMDVLRVSHVKGFRLIKDAIDGIDVAVEAIGLVNKNNSKEILNYLYKEQGNLIMVMRINGKNYNINLLELYGMEDD